MAKKKITEDAAPASEQVKAPETEPQKENVEGVDTKESETAVETAEVDNPDNSNLPEKETEKENDNTEVAVEPQATIPDHVLAYLKRHAEEKEVYIDKLGGVFSANTPRVFLKDAVLYQNPFFKQ